MSLRRVTRAHMGLIDHCYRAGACFTVGSRPVRHAEGVAVKLVVRLVSVAVAVALTATAAIAAVSNTRGGATASVEKMQYVWTTESSSTRSTEWRSLTGWMTIVADGAMTTTVSADFTGAPVEVRVLDGFGNRVMRPGKARFATSPGDSSRSFSFVAEDKKSQCRFVKVQWRSPTGKKVTSNRLAVVVMHGPVEAPAPHCV